MLFNINFFNIILLSIVYHHASAYDDDINSKIEEFSWNNSDYSEVETFEPIVPCGTGSDTGIHVCVPYHHCDVNTVSMEDKIANTINIRFMSSQCSETLHVCCLIGSVRIPVDNESVRNMTSQNCGIRNINGIDFKLVNNVNFEAEYGEFPWMTAILKNNYNPQIDKSVAICGGSIITPSVIITAAHCVKIYNPSDIRIRAGEWDTQMENERLPHQERNIKDIIIHKEFHVHTVYNDIALLILESALHNAEHLGTICLPPQGIHFNAADCFSTGWGKDVFGKEGEYQVILKKRQLSTVPFDICERALQKERLGKEFKLHKSFMCAGGVKDIDMCVGDGGGPLVCPDPQNPKRYLLAGIVSWGLGCNRQNVPGVYVDVARYRTWVDQQMSILKLDTNPYGV